ncbi:RNA polymerase sigma factor [Spirosoma sp. 209]|uniref:RNA polymerase sigma factor n=1 Tax=Spirosoma sp. 209 TaxID=1955701 RepID=UPI00098D0FA1|nr:sigma-70 family RNA polymerase sigma factor [Spirosoma sp. 209]
MKQKLTDEELVNNYLETHQNDYFEQLYERYCHKVHRKCLSFTKDDVQAQDLTQDIFLRLMTRLDSYKHQARFSTWLYSVTHNYCTDQIRGANKRQALTGDNDWDTLDVSADDGIAEQEEQIARRIHRAMTCLSADEQMLLHQRYQDGISVKELAMQHALTESAVKMRLKRSRDRLRQYYWQND